MLALSQSALNSNALRTTPDHIEPLQPLPIAQERQLDSELRDSPTVLKGTIDSDRQVCLRVSLAKNNT